MTSPKTGKTAALENQLKRVMADYDNFKKRTAKDQLDFVRFSNSELLNKLLPVLDDLERAENHLNDQGLKLAVNKLRDTLKAEGLIELELAGQNYDPATAEAVEVVEGTKDQVVEVVRKGYKLNDQVVRAAQVKVGGK